AHYAAMAHGPGDRGRGSTATIEPTLWHQSDYPLRGVVAAVGDVRRFTHSKKLVAYLGLNPSVSQSGNFQGSGALKRHGRGALRALLIQSGKKLLEVNNPLQKWGLAVAARLGRNKAAVAVARKLCVALWHLMMGHAIGTLERLDT